MFIHSISVAIMSGLSVFTIRSDFDRCLREIFILLMRKLIGLSRGHPVLVDSSQIINLIMRVFDKFPQPKRIGLTVVMVLMELH